MSDVIGILERSADLVQQWGGSVLADGRTVSTHLTYHDLSLWDVIAVDLAVYLVPQALLPGSRRRSWYRMARASLGRLRSRIRNAPPRRMNASGCEAWPHSPTYLLLGFSDYLDRDVLAPVANSLAGTANTQPMTLFDGRRDDRTAHREPHAGTQSIWQHWTADTAQDYRRLQTWLGGQPDRVRRLGLEQVIRDQERSLWVEMQPVFDFVFRRHLPALLGEVAVARHLFASHCPTAVISPDVADPRTRIYSLLGRVYEVPILHIAYADIFGRECTEWRFLQGGLVAAAGEKTRDAVAAQGVPPELVAVTGSVRHDRIVETSPEEGLRVRSDLGVQDGEPMVLFASTVSLNAYDGIRDRDKLINAKATILGVTEGIETIQLIVKPHPLEDVRETTRLAGRSTRLKFVDRRLDIRSLTIACDIFITLGSSATVGALIARKLVIYPTLGDEIYWDDQFVGSGAVLVVRSGDELENVLRTAAGGGTASLLDKLEPARQAFLRAWAFNPDGHASARVAALARRMVSERSAFVPTFEGAAPAERNR